jgi:hypothetical protein
MCCSRTIRWLQVQRPRSGPAAAAGPTWIQIDEPSAAIVPGHVVEYVKMFNACVEGVRAPDRLPCVLRNLLSRPCGKRTYRWMFSALLECRCDQFVFEYANREMTEIEMWREVGVDRDVACYVLDVVPHGDAGGRRRAGALVPPAHPGRAPRRAGMQLLPGAPMGGPFERTPAPSGRTPGGSPRGGRLSALRGLMLAAHGPGSAAGPSQTRDGRALGPHGGQAGVPRGRPGGPQ